MEFHSIKQDGELKRSPTQEELRQKYIDSLKNGTPVKETLTKQSPNKTHQQVKAFWAMIIAMTLAEFDDRGWDTSILLHLPEPTGVPVSKDLLKEYLYAACPVFDEHSNRVTLSKMSIEQAMEQFESIRNFVASQWSIYIPEPDKNWKDKVT